MDFNYVTPEEAYSLDLLGSDVEIEEYVKRADNDGFCPACNTRLIWKLGGKNLCFHCTKEVPESTDVSSEFELLSDDDFDDVDLSPDNFATIYNYTENETDDVPPHDIYETYDCHMTYKEYMDELGPEESPALWVEMTDNVRRNNELCALFFAMRWATINEVLVEFMHLYTQYIREGKTISYACHLAAKDFDNYARETA